MFHVEKQERKVCVFLCKWNVSRSMKIENREWKIEGKCSSCRNVTRVEVVVARRRNMFFSRHVHISSYHECLLALRTMNVILFRKGRYTYP